MGSCSRCRMAKGKDAHGGEAHGKVLKTLASQAVPSFCFKNAHETACLGSYCLQAGWQKASLHGGHHLVARSSQSSSAGRCGCGHRAGGGWLGWLNQP